MGVPPQPNPFHYVYIPADPSEPIQERQLKVEPGKEVEGLLDVLKAHFRTTGGEKTDKQRKAHEEQLRAQVGAAADKLDPAVLQIAMDMGMVESIPLLVNKPSSRYVAVNLYCDDQAQIKELPLNPRASQIAETCGNFLEVRGDAFLGRIFDNDDAFVRMDFRLGEVSSSSPWMKEAKAQAEARIAEGDRSQKFMEQLQTGKGNKPPPPQIRELTPAEVLKEEGNAVFKSGDLVKAVQQYSAALDLDPQLVAALNNRSLVHLKLGNTQAAFDDCTKVLDLEPRNVKALLRRGAAGAALGKLSDAVANYQAVLGLEPHNKEAAQELAKLQQQQQQQRQEGQAQGEQQQQQDVPEVEMEQQQQ